MASNQNNKLPLVVDLDGTLVKTDFLYESFLLFIKQNPLNVFLALFWLITENRGVMKSRIAERVDIDVSLFPYNSVFIDWLKTEKARGRKIILATASHQKYAQAVAKHLDIFDDVIATDGADNLKGSRKEARLIEDFGVKGFDYAGDSTADFSVWRSANAAVVVSSSKAFLKKVESKFSVVKHFVTPQKPASLWRALRPHQWLKNLLIFVPLFTSHSFANAFAWKQAVLAFIAFSLCASSIYIINDFLDLQADRKHRSKRLRPFAAGDVSITLGAFMSLACLICAFLIASLVSFNFIIALLAYLLITTLYSFYLKHIMLADIMVLAGLFTLRIIAGAVAIDVPLSFWLLAFSIFLFLSLAIIKRYTELLGLRDIAASTSGLSQVTTRGYHIDDMAILSSLGGASGYLSVLVMAFYLNSEDILKLYEHPQILWLVCPAMLYWISRIWILTHRGKVDDDPIVFVIKDHASRYVALFVFGLFALAT